MWNVYELQWKLYRDLHKKNEYECKTSNTKEIIYVKKQIWLTNVSYLRLSIEHFMDISICIYVYICVQFQKLLA